MYYRTIIKLLFGMTLCGYLIGCSEPQLTTFDKEVAGLLGVSEQQMVDAMAVAIDGIVLDMVDAEFLTPEEGVALGQDQEYVAELQRHLLYMDDTLETIAIQLENSVEQVADARDEAYESSVTGLFNDDAMAAAIMGFYNTREEDSRFIWEDAFGITPTDDRDDWYGLAFAEETPVEQSEITSVIRTNYNEWVEQNLITYDQFEAISNLPLCEHDQFSIFTGDGPGYILPYDLSDPTVTNNILCTQNVQGNQDLTGLFEGVDCPECHGTDGSGGGKTTIAVTGNSSNGGSFLAGETKIGWANCDADQDRFTLHVIQGEITRVTIKHGSRATTWVNVKGFKTWCGPWTNVYLTPRVDAIWTTDSNLKHIDKPTRG
jgi:hypothetical protein